MSAEHTPTPWVVFPSGDRHGIDSIEGESIVIFGEGRNSLGIKGRSKEEGHANAAFIVRAVNAHDDLVIALTNALRALDSIRDGRYPTIFNECSVALAKASA